MPPSRPSSGFSRGRGRSPARVAIFGAAGLTVVACLLLLLFNTPPTQQASPSQPPVQQPVVELKDCLVAIEKIEPGTALDPSKFKKETLPVVSSGADLITTFEQLRGAYAVSFIAAGQPLLADYISTKAPVNEIQGSIPDGHRAVSVAVNDVSAVEGWVRTGAKVDVMLTSHFGGKPAITLLAQNARVLSAGGQTSVSVAEGARQATTVTILVTIDEATKIQLASTSGTMSLALRGDEDTVESPDSQTVTLDGVLGVSTPRASSGPPREGRITVGGRNYLIVGGKMVPEEVVEEGQKARP